MARQQPFAETLAMIRTMDHVQQLRLAYCILNGPVEDIITGEEAAEFGILNAENGLIDLIFNRDGEIDDIQP